MITLNNRQLCENCFSAVKDGRCPDCGFDSRRYVHDPMTLPMGCVLGDRYCIGGVIGKGGFGITYLGYDLRLNAKIAVKEYYPVGLAVRNPSEISVTITNQKAEEPFRQGAEKFYNEASMVAQFNANPNIVSVHDFFYENNTVYFVMDFLKGQTLKSYVRGGRISEAQAVRLIYDIGNALETTHSRDILHRDISPDNIMICEDGNIRLLDFGAAREVVSDHEKGLSVILKHGFAPLEQYQKKGNQGPWTDIYALGATVYNALTGDTLDDPITRFSDDTHYQSNDHGISPGLWSIIKKATMLEIKDRYQSITEMLQEVRALQIDPRPFDAASRSELADTVKLVLETSEDKGDPNATELLGGSYAKPFGADQTVAMTPKASAGTIAEPMPQYDRSIPPQRPVMGPGNANRDAGNHGNRLALGLIFTAAAIMLTVIVAVISVFILTKRNEDTTEKISAEEVSEEDEDTGGSEEASEEASETEAEDDAAEEETVAEEAETAEWKLISCVINTDGSNSDEPFMFSDYGVWQAHYVIEGPEGGGTLMISIESTNGDRSSEKIELNELNSAGYYVASFSHGFDGGTPPAGVQTEVKATAPDGTVISDKYFRWR